MSSLIQREQSKTTSPHMCDRWHPLPEARSERRIFHAAPGVEEGVEKGVGKDVEEGLEEGVEEGLRWWFR